MGRKDEICFEFWRKHPECYAEVFNRLVFERNLVDWHDLREQNVKLAFPEGKREFRRDNLRETAVTMQDEKRTYVFLGIEDSSYVDYAAPVKEMLYNALTLRNQLYAEKKGLKGDEYLSSFPKGGILKPVITVFLDWTGKVWDGPRSLFELFDPEELEVLKPFLNDYRIHVISPAELEEKQILGLKTELREILAFQKYRNDKKNLKRIVYSDQYRYRSLSGDTVELIATMTDTRLRFEGMKEEGEGVNMCLGIDQLIEEAFDKGRRESEEKLRKAEAYALKANENAQREKAEKEAILKEYMELRKQLQILMGNQAEVLQRGSASV